MKFSIDFSDKKWFGLKLMTVSFLVALFGAVLANFGIFPIAQLVVITGIAGGVVGMAFHTYAFFKSFRGLRR